MTASDRRILTVLGMALFFEGYGRSLVVVTLPYIGRDLAAPAATLSYGLAAIATGSLAALVLGPVADAVGRRRLLLGSIGLFSLFGGLTASATLFPAVIVWQACARAFQESALFSAAVLLAEEMPARARAEAQGILGAVNACGSGTVAFLFAFVTYLPGGWRSLCLVALLPLVLLPFFRRTIPETGRWLARDRTVRVRFTPHTIGRLAAALAVVALATACDVAGFAFTTYVPMELHGWSAADAGSMVVVAGLIGLPGWWIGGRVADNYGRRATAVVFLVGLSAALAVFFLAGPRALWPAFAVMVFCQGGKTAVLRAWTTELFPTAIRATTTGWLAAGGTVGGIAGLAGAATLAPVLGGIAPALVAIAATGIVAAAVAWLTLPETWNVDLD